MSRIFKLFIFIASLVATLPLRSIEPNVFIRAEDQFFGGITQSTAEPGHLTGTIDRISAIVEKGHAGLSYIGRDEVLDSLYAVSNAANNLVQNGITIHTNKALPQLCFGITGLVASLCGITIVTSTALKKQKPESKQKYLVGCAMAGLGLASLGICSLFKNTAPNPDLITINPLLFLNRYYKLV